MLSAILNTSPPVRRLIALAHRGGGGLCPGLGGVRGARQRRLGASRDRGKAGASRPVAERGGAGQAPRQRRQSGGRGKSRVSHRRQRGDHSRRAADAAERDCRRQWGERAVGRQCPGAQRSRCRLHRAAGQSFGAAGRHSQRRSRHRNVAAGAVHSRGHFAHDRCRTGRRAERRPRDLLPRSCFTARCKRSWHRRQAGSNHDREVRGPGDCGMYRGSRAWSMSRSTTRRSTSRPSPPARGMTAAWRRRRDRCSFPRPAISARRSSVRCSRRHAGNSWPRRSRRRRWRLRRRGRTDRRRHRRPRQHPPLRLRFLASAFTAGRRKPCCASPAAMKRGLVWQWRDRRRLDGVGDRQGPGGAGAGRQGGAGPALSAMEECPASPPNAPRTMSDRTSHESAGAGHESASAGFSLVAVLVFMLIVSAIVVPFAVTAKTRLMIANNEVEQERLSLLAEGLGNVVASELTGGSETKKSCRWISRRPRAGREISASIVRVQDHGGLIDLNAADDTLLALGLRSARLRAADGASTGQGRDPVSRQRQAVCRPAPAQKPGRAARRQAGAVRIGVRTAGVFGTCVDAPADPPCCFHGQLEARHDQRRSCAEPSSRGSCRRHQRFGRCSVGRCNGLHGRCGRETRRIRDRRRSRVHHRAVSGQPDGILARLPKPGHGGRRIAGSRRVTTGCEVLFGAEATQILRGWSS